MGAEQGAMGWAMLCSAAAGCPIGALEGPVGGDCACGGGVDQRVIDHITGHQAQGTGGRHYLDPRALWEPMVAAVALVPPLSAAPVQVRGRRRVGSPRDQGGQE